jgi:MtN3 and saliva related transmembrane protein
MAKELAPLKTVVGGMTVLGTAIGLIAAFCTTVSYIPQVVKCWKTRKAGDLSLKMLLTLATGLALWVAYGFINGDWVIITANAVSLFLLGNLLLFKVGEILPWGGNLQRR